MRDSSAPREEKTTSPSCAYSWVDDQSCSAPRARGIEHHCYLTAGHTGAHQCNEGCDAVSPPRVEGLPEWAAKRIARIREGNAVEPYAQSDPAALVILLADELARLTRDRDGIARERSLLASRLAALQSAVGQQQSALDALAVAVKPVREHVEQWKGLDADYGARDARDAYILAAPQVNELLSAITALLDGRTTT